MFGLMLSKEFYENEARPLLISCLPDLMPHVAIGLVGEGSECFAFDDEISQDHDFGPGFCLWLPESEMKIWEKDIENFIEKLLPVYKNFPTRMSKQKRMDRLGLLSIEAFYYKYTGLTRPPQTWQEWRTIPEHFLATATNGMIFHDPSMRFSNFRNALLDYYPEDVRLKKMAARLAVMAQAGQYNLVRAIKRQDQITCMLCVQKFSEAALSFTFLCNKKYMPFYKWAPKALENLDTLSSETLDCLNALTNISFHSIDMAIDLIEEHASIISNYLNKEGYTQIEDSWLLAHASQLQNKIGIAQLRNLPEMAE